MINKILKRVALAVTGGMLALVAVVGVVQPAAAATVVTCARKTPTVAVVAAEQSGFAGSTVTYTVNVTNNDTARCLASQITVTPQGVPAGWTTAVSPNFDIFVLPGRTVAFSVDVTSDSAAAVGPYTLTAVTKQDRFVAPGSTVNSVLTYNVVSN